MWQKTDKNHKYGVAVYNYKSILPHRLLLLVGDTVHIDLEAEGWYYGYTTRDKSQKGLFPKSYVHVREAIISKHGSLEKITPRESPLVNEITSVLREWHATWKQFYSENNHKLDKVLEMMLELIDWRKKIMSEKQTNEELKDLQQKISSKIDSGNAMLELDLMVRDEQGNILNPDTTSVVELFKQHGNASDKVTTDLNSAGNSDVTMNWPQTFNLYVILRNFVCRIGEDADILMSLYDVKHGKFISENYIVKWGKDGVPKDLDMLNNFKVVFTDLGAKDRQLEKVSIVFQVIRIGVMDPKDVDDKKQTRSLRRPFGVAALDISDLMQGTKEYNEDQQVFIPFQSCGEKEFMETLIKKVVVAKEINHKGQGLWVSMKILHGDAKQVKEDYPYLVAQNTAVSRKLGFPDVILPGDVRNDIYITLRQGEFNKGPAKTCDKNVEVTMLVCNRKGELLKGVISHGCGGEMMSEYKSLIYYHEDKPKWFETIKVAISTDEEFKGLHLKFLFKHKSTSESKDKSERPFAMSFVKLMNKNGTTLSDTDHNLLVYKIDSKCADHNMIEKKDDGTSPYLDLPATREDLDSQDIQKGSKIVLFSGPFTLSQKDSFQISTFVCSTKLTHNVDLLGLLKWQEIMNDTTSLHSHLTKLMHVDGEEIVKFLQDLLDSLFSILMQNTISDHYDNMVFESLVHIIGLISDRKYHQFRLVLDAYVDNSFSFAMAYQKLMVILKDYVDKALETNQKILTRAMKSLEYLFKFIVKSRKHFAVLNDDRGKQAFELTLKGLIKSINSMMTYSSDNTLLAQGAALKYMSATVTDILTVFDHTELSHLMVEFINNVPKERLTKQKLKCIDDLVHSDLFKFSDCRQILLPMMLNHTSTLMKKGDETEDCVGVLSDIMNTTFSKETGVHYEDILLVVKMSLRTVIQSCIPIDRGSKTVKKCVAVLMSMFRQMNERHYQTYIEGFPLLTDLRDFLLEILSLFKDLIENPVFPGNWMEMFMLQNSIMLRALQSFAKTIHIKFTQEFDTELWECFFHCAIAFLTQKHLQLEQFSNAKRTKIVCRYGDMRREAGFEIRQMWSHLGDNKIHFIPSLVEPILKMTLIPEPELRKATIPIFFDMMQCEFCRIESSTRKPKGHFHLLENELILKLDALIEEGWGDEEYKELMYDILFKLCNSHKSLREQGLEFVHTIKELLQRLLEYRKIIQIEVKEHRMSCIVNLLNFYHNIGRQEMYIRYVNKLCDLHLQCDNYTEAANTLLLHVNLLQWSETPLDPMLKAPKYKKADTHRQLKENLYYDIISLYDKGKMWERGIGLCKELVDLYEEELFDYERLSVILRREADLFQCIIKEVRADPEYFRVAYYGRGFPTFLQNKVFIYRGKEYERLADFNARMQTLFPNAELLRSLSPPGVEIEESSKQYLQINAVSPVLEPQDRFADKHINEKILKYYTVNEVQKFTYSRRMEESSGEIAEMWLERTFLTISYALPGILCWFPVVSTEVIEVSPLENAIETLETKNKAINSLIEQHAADPELNCSGLGMQLNGVVDASVNGGISNYKLFYTDGYAQTEKDGKFVKKLKEITCQQMMLLREALNIHKRKVSDEMRPFHALMEQRFTEMARLMQLEYKLKIPDSQSMSTLKRFKSMSAVSLSRVSEAFVSMSSEGSNYATPVTKSSSPASRSPSVFVKGDKSAPSPSSNKGGLRQQVSHLNLFKRASVANSDPSIDGGGSNRDSLEAPIELSEQQLTPKRPMRPETNERRHSRPISSQFTLPSVCSSSTASLHSNASSLNDNVSDTESSDEPPPPPIPEKTTYADYSNIETPPVSTRSRTVSTHSINRKSKPVPTIPAELSNGSPPPVPKKLTPHKQ